MPFTAPSSMDSTIEILGEEIPLILHFDYSPEEPEVNAGERASLCSVEFVWRDSASTSLAYEDLSGAVTERLEQQCLEYVHEQAQSYYEGDG